MPYSTTVSHTVSLLSQLPVHLSLFSPSSLPSGYASHGGGDSEVQAELSGTPAASQGSIWGQFWYVVHSITSETRHAHHEQEEEGLRDVHIQLGHGQHLLLLLL